MMQATRNPFWHDERGSAAIDWVALAAGVLLLGVMTVYALFRVGVDDMSSAIDAALSAAECGDALPESDDAGPRPDRGLSCPADAPPRFN